jgi:CrcB protein
VSFSGLIAIGGGAAAGAWLRWWLGVLLNPIFPTLPLGTLAANLIGGWLMGLSMGFMAHFESLPPEMRLLLTTGFLGGLTTFSTFSAETATLISREQFGWTAAIVAMHVIGSVMMTLLGMAMIGMVLKR